MIAVPSYSYAVVRVSALEDMNLGSWDGESDMTGEEYICVFSASYSYTLVAQGEGPGGSFILRNALERLPYEVSYSDRIFSGQHFPVTANQPINRLFTFQATSSRCGYFGFPSARLQVTIPASELNNAVPGVYRGILRLTVIAE
ncbi:MAG: hypothetical protein SVU69_10370 [Pseudomonadota bacterium]|nr:hypothetical protein [Pseudomonadota bacterium]